MEMSPAARECRRQYMRDWRKKHPEKAREGRVSYWEKKAAEEARNREAAEAAEAEKIELEEFLR